MNIILAQFLQKYHQNRSDILQSLTSFMPSAVSGACFYTDLFVDLL